VDTGTVTFANAVEESNTFYTKTQKTPDIPIAENCQLFLEKTDQEQKGGGFDYRGLRGKSGVGLKPDLPMIPWIRQDFLLTLLMANRYQN